MADLASASATLVIWISPFIRKLSLPHTIIFILNWHCSTHFTISGDWAWGVHLCKTNAGSVTRTPEELSHRHEFYRFFDYLSTLLQLQRAWLKHWSLGWSLWQTKCLWLTLRYYPRIYLQGLSKTSSPTSQIQSRNTKHPTAKFDYLMNFPPSQAVWNLDV
jgi:hypothetical protein